MPNPPESLRTAADLLDCWAASGGKDNAAGDDAKNGSAKGDQEEVAPPGKKAIMVPNDFVIYKCKISKNRVIDIPLPADFKTADVKRLHAFLLTQVDDEPPAQSNGE